jgi:hypothetical protein
MDLSLSGLAMGLPPVDQPAPFILSQVRLIEDETRALILTDDCGSHDNSATTDSAPPTLLAPCIETIGPPT